MKLVDSHAHLDFDDFHSDFDSVILRAKQSGVEKIINIGASLERSQASVTLADNYDNIFAVVGVHPEEADKVKLETLHDELLHLAKSSKKVVGIGETGLDYYQLRASSLEPRETGREKGPTLNSPDQREGGSDPFRDTKDKQKKLFKIHIDVAKHLGLPLVVHIRNGEDEDAVNTAYEILKETNYHKGVIHCFTLNADWAKRFLDLGFSLGFTGIITYKNADDICEAVTATPLESILVETDCPFLAPQKYRGKRNEPSYVVEISNKIAELKGLTLEKVAEQTTINVERLFHI